MSNKGTSSLVAVVSALLAVGIGGCAKQAQDLNGVSDKNLVTATDPKANKIIGDDQNQFAVQGKQAFLENVSANRIALVGSPVAESILSSLADSASRTSNAAARKPKPKPQPPTPVKPDQPATPPAKPAAPQDNSLVLGYPIGLLGQQNIFGAVITAVSDKNDQKLGQLKLTDLPPLAGQTVISKQADGTYLLGLVGCIQNCSEASDQQGLIAFPVLGVDQDKGLVMLDLAPLGKQLDLISMLDPGGQFTQLKAKSSLTTAMDYSVSTLVFDIESHMIALDKDVTDPTAPETVFTTRWFLKLASGFNPAFVSRAPTQGVGFFTTERGVDTKITRWSSTDYGRDGLVHYFIKNVPTQYQPAFASCFDEWNAKLQPVIGKKMFSYEFVNADDPRSKLLVTGDVRYNIVEWDLINKAPYGGLGPSIANQLTGETFTADVLIQGPTIIDLYSHWYKANVQAQALREIGRSDEAEELMVQTKRDLEAQQAQLSGGKLELKLNNLLAFRVTSQTPALEDPLMQRDDFDDVPAGFTFDQYMYGYFHDMLTHELGHNLGLRHNFRGNLGAADVAVQGGVSRSIMEYLGRSTRYLDQAGEYDIMALSYGYTGKQPDHLNWFCTDEDNQDITDPTKSAECSRDDATNDPFSWLEGRLTRAVTLLTNKGQTTAPAWAVTDMDSELSVAINGLAAYAVSGDATASGWTNFFGKPGRPANAAGVKAFVLGRFKAQICDPALTQLVAGKATPDAKTKTQANIDALRAKIATVLAPKVFTADELKCN